jgi:RHS repeat-associated protein
VESVTPAENPGSYEICWDVVNASGAYFSAEGGNEYCAPYTVQQYPPQINEQEPLPGTDVDSQTPQLSASAIVPGGYPASPVFSYAFQILNGPNPSTATVLQSSAWVAGSGNSWAPTTPLTWGTTYYWRVTVSDAVPPPALTSSGITWTTPVSFVVGNAQAAVSGRLGDTYQADDGNPIMTSDLGSTDYSGSGKTVDPKTGNLAQQATDASVATVGPPLSIERTYNSLDPRTSQALGAGWSSRLDMSLVPDQDGSGALILTLADGQQVRFAKNSAGGYAPPQDLYAVVSTLSGGGFAVTDQTGTTYKFGQASGSSWLLSAITDNTGKTETFTYSGGTLSTITSASSGRALHLTWSTPSGAGHPHVATVATDPVTAGQPATALTWTYGYSGDLLTKVCPPGTSTACTSYGYITNGSHAPTSVLNSDPTSYYRLDEPAGATAAVNQIPADDLTTLDPPATEMNTTPGVAGPVPGVTATGFNGSSSWIPLDGTWCTTPGQESSCAQTGGTGRVLNIGAGSLAVSIWFKTSTASGTLLGDSNYLPSGSSCNSCTTIDTLPLLWIGSDGRLNGMGSIVNSGYTLGLQPYNYTATALTSPAAVDNGAWHQAVLIPGQALFLDGKEVATGSASVSLPTGDSAVLGAGLFMTTQCGDGCYTSSSWQYFNGSMADVSVYQNQLPSVGTVAAQYAAEAAPAAELNSVTSPAGRTELSATYDTVNDRVATLTDTDGGSWKYGGQVRTSSSAAYDGGVMANSPLDFWPLNDAVGPLAHDLAGGAATAANPRPPATYANVTLGKAGPTGFPDGTAASFNGSSSQISIPGGYFAGTGAESAELWFKTTAQGTLLSTGSSAKNGGEPMALWIPSGSTCMEGQIGSTLLNVNSFFGTCLTGDVTDGNWHQAVLTLTPGSTCPAGSTTCTPGSFTQTATLYQDGTVLDTEQITKAATASPTGYVAYIGSGPNTGQRSTPDGYFNGSIADVSLYVSALNSDQVTSDLNALSDQVTAPVTGPPGFGGTPTVTLPTLNTQTITVTDPNGKNAVYTYASGALVRATSVLGGVSSYGYDTSLRASTITDADGDTTYMTYDAHNNVTSTTSCAAINNCQTSYTAYYENLSNPLDPRNDKPTDSRDARSSSPTDPTYDTVTTYTPAAQLATRTTPARPACPAGCKTSYAYTAGTEAAVGGGTEPAGLLASVTAPGGGVTGYAYDSGGDVMQSTNPLGLVTKYSYDNLGRPLTDTQISSTFPAGLTTSYTYDGQDRLLTETDPPVTDRVTGAVHTKMTSYSYDADAKVLTTTISDLTGGDPSRVTTDTYNPYGELATAKDALGNTTSYTYDALGDRISQTNPAGVTTAYTYDDAGNLLTSTLQGYTGNPGSPSSPANLVLESRAYDPAGRLASVTNVKGTQTDYTYYGNNQLASSYVVGSTGPQSVSTYGYDAAGNQITQTAPGGLVVNTAYNPDSQVVSQVTDPTGVDNTVTASYDADGNVVGRSLAGGGVTQTETMTYNPMDQQLTQTISNTGGNLTTTVTRDQSGLVVSETDPAGHTTTIANDEAGRPANETAPAVPAQTGSGAAPVTANPVTTTGYDTFGDEVESSDANGNITKYAFDQDGQQVSVTDPSYTPPGSSTPVQGTTTTTYNNLGEQVKTTDPLGNVTQDGYDQLGDLASQTDPDGGVWTYAYDPAGEQTSVTDPTGAQTQATYDTLGRMITSTDLVRQNASAAYTTSYGYDDAGDLTSQTSPTGVKTTAAYNAVGEQVSVTDGAGNTTGYSYDLDGNPVKVTLPDGTATTAAYDLAGRQTSLSDLSSTGTVLRTESASYNPDGQITSAVDFRGNTTTSVYDATGMLTSQTQPVSAGNTVTVSYGYDLAGNQTALTDGNGNTTYTTYNSRSLPQAITEPATAAHSSSADSVTTDLYDADGNLVTQNLPGGVQVASTYDKMGDLTGQSGSGAAAPTASRTFTYDTAGRVLTAATGVAGTSGTAGYQPATTESFGYDDRGLLLSASGAAGTSTFTYNGSAQPASVADAAGTSTYTYDTAGRLATDADAASGTTGSYTYNNLDQVTKISYGTGNDSQSFGYDSLHRLTSDAIATSGGTQVAAIGYGYDANDDVTSMTTTGLATTGGGTGTVASTYGYDQAGRLTSWTATPTTGSAVTKTYGYDKDGNLTSNNGVTYSYDARDELTSDGSSSYAYAADGDLTSQAGSSGTTTYSSDAYGQQITDAASQFSYDALDRLVSAAKQNVSGSIALTYDGMTNEVASDSSASYSRDPAGAIVGVNSAAGGKTLALDNQHDDLSGTFTAAGAALASSTTWDPWGQVLGTAGTAVQVGYQGQWTDPVTGQVSMGSRFYKPAAGGFINQDTYTGGQGGPAVAGNLHAYAGDNPMSVTDPSGHSPSASKGSGGGVTAGQIAAAAARAAEAHAKAAAAAIAAAVTASAAVSASVAAHGAAALARLLNSAAARAAVLAARAAQLAAAAFKAAQAELQVAQSWQDKADAAWQAAWNDLRQAKTWEVWKIPGYLAAAARETGIALYDEARAGAAFIEYGILEAAAYGLQAAADIAAGAAKVAELVAKGAVKAADIAADLADAAARTAEILGAIAAKEAGIAAHDDAVVAELTAAYAKQMARKAAKALRAAARVVKAAAKKVARAAVVVAKAAYKYSGAQDVVSCVTDPHLANCLKAAATIALVVATGGEGEVEVAAIDAAEEAGTDAAEQAGGNVVKDAVESCETSFGGQSFTAATKVLLANGKAVPISSLKPGEKVLATNTRTGQTRAETITAVLVHHDADLYDLTIKANGRTAVIDTTTSHPFWDATTRRWVKAAALRYGTHLRTPSGDTATVLGGRPPRDRFGRMWDLTIPGDHDFYINTTAADILVHNCDISNPESFTGASRADAETELQENGWYNAGPTREGGGVRWRLPDNPADQARIMPGNMADPNIIKQGPYIRFSLNGIKHGPYPLSSF